MIARTAPRCSSLATALALALVLPACVDDVELTVDEAALGGDADGDGYTGNDCNDGNVDIHPHRKELANGVDDNCNGDIDEPMLAYSPRRPLENAVFAKSPTFDLRVTDAATIAYLDAGGTIGYTITFQRLNAGSTPNVTSALLTEAIVPGGNWTTRLWMPPGQPSVLFRVLTIDPNRVANNLQVRTVYRFKVQLTTATGSALGPSSEWFYSVTAGTTASPNDTRQWGRVDLALQAFDQLGDSEDGVIGKFGIVDPDGSRFVDALHPNYHAGEEVTGWCDWFYRYQGVMVTDGLDGNLSPTPVLDGGNTFWSTTMNPNNVPNAFRDPEDDGCGTEIGDDDGNGVANEVLYQGCQSYAPGAIRLDLDDNQFYSNIVGNIYYDAIRSRPDNQGFGNYQAMDSHAGMFLGFDPAGDGTFAGAGTTGTVWSIEGNVGDRVQVKHRAGNDPFINGFGKVTEAMFQP